MLAPQDRHLLLESLRPPDGYVVDQAVGTTFSLDLTALLLPPLAFALFDRQDERGRITRDPLALLEAVRRYADRISLFCQAGQIHVPKAILPIHAYLEESVFEARAANPGGAFHPKVWVLRMIAEGQPVLYRALWLSRNLTFDCSWDTILVLDGMIADRKNAIRANLPLAEFVRALPGLAVRPVPDRVRAQIDRVAEEIGHVEFEAPEGIESIAFWPMGLPGNRRRPLRGDVNRLLVISPFISEGPLTEMSGRAQESILVSRAEMLDRLATPCLARFAKIYALSSTAAPEDQESGEDEPITEPPLSGLHAKLYITESGWKATVWTGSANATTAAFRDNVEFLVEMVGPKKTFGIDAALAREQGQAGFGNLLEEYTPASTASETDAVQEEIERMTDDVVRVIAFGRFVCDIGPEDGRHLFDVEVRPEEGHVQVDPKVASVTCWPVSLPPAAAAEFQAASNPCVSFARLTYEALTSFFAFEVAVRDRGRSASRRFVLNLPLRGAPVERREKVLRALLRSRADVTRFLLLLLAKDDRDFFAGAGARSVNGERHSVPTFGATGPALFESLVRTLERDPKRLDSVERLIGDLGKSGDGVELLPEGFDAIWRPILEARARLRP
ncbi:MAG: phospholipase D family protein [bacterium]